MSRTLIVSLFVAALITAAPLTAAAQRGEGATFATTWNAYSDKEKRAFLVGLATGIRIICTDMTVGMGKQSDPEFINKQFRECFNSYVGYDPDAVIKNMNEMYADKQNALIPMDGVYKMSVMKARGDKIDDLLIQARKYGAGLKKHIDEEMKKK